MRGRHQMKLYEQADKSNKLMNTGGGGRGKKEKETAEKMSSTTD